MVEDSEDVAHARLARLRDVMRSSDVSCVLTADPINIFYQSNVRNMTVFSMMGAFRFALLVRDGPLVLWEFGGAEHLATASPLVDEVRAAPAVTAVGSPHYEQHARELAREVAEFCHRAGAKDLWIERIDLPLTDALRETGLELRSATPVFVEARRIKGPGEIAMMRDAVRRVDGALESMLGHLVAGATEVEVWSHFHQGLIESGGEYVSTRLVQAGARTFPYFNEAGANVLSDGDLFCIDTDAIGVGGYAVDFSRTYIVGGNPTDAQRRLHKHAVDQVEHNAALLAPGLSYEDFANHAWPVPDEHRATGYYCMAHGLGLSGEFPYVPVAEPGVAYPLPGGFEPGMVVCLESYIGDATLEQGVKIENQYLITETGSELMSQAPFDPSLTA